MSEDRKRLARELEDEDIILDFPEPPRRRGMWVPLERYEELTSAARALEEAEEGNEKLRNELQSARAMMNVAESVIRKQPSRTYQLQTADMLHDDAERIKAMLRPKAREEPE